MSQAEELLNELTESIPVHDHTVKDSDSRFIINPTTKEITYACYEKKVLMQRDHNSEIFTIEVPRYIEGHDMLLCNVVKVHYNNIDGKTNEENADVKDLYDLQIDPENEDVAICTWTVTRESTQLAGTLNFLVQYSCVDENGNSTYDWYTDIYADVEIRAGRNNGRQVVIEHSDILEQWRAKLFGNGTSEYVTKEEFNQLSEEKVDKTTFEQHTGNGNVHVTSEEKQTWNNKATTEYVVSEINDLKAQGIQQTPLFANNISECTDTTKVYVLPDGYIYAYMYVEENAIGENLWTFGDVQISKYQKYDLNIPAGEYVIKATVTSTDTDSQYSVVNFYNDSKVAQVDFIRDSEIEKTVTLSQDVTKLYLYTSSDTTKSEGDTANYTGIVIARTASEAGYYWQSTGRAFIPTDYEDRIIALEEDKFDKEKVVQELGEDDTAVMSQKAVTGALSKISDKRDSDVEYIQNPNLYDGSTVNGRLDYNTGKPYSGSSTHMRNETPVKLDSSKAYNVAVKVEYVKGTLYLYKYDTDMNFIEMISKNGGVIHVENASYVNFHIASYQTDFPNENLHVMVWESDNPNENYKEWLEYGETSRYYNNKLLISESQLGQVLLAQHKAMFDDSFNYVAYSQVVGSDGDINTAEHFKWASKQGFTALKGDVQPTADGKLVMCHDAGFSIGSHGYIDSYNVETATPIHDMTLEECLALQHSGEKHLHVCSFDEYIKICKKYGKIAYITIRDSYIDEAVSAMFTVLDKYNMRTRCIINSFTLSTLQAVREVDNEITLSQVLGTGEKITTKAIDRAVSLGNCQICGFDFPTFGRFDDITESVVAYAKEKDIRLYQAQVNSMEDIDMLMEYGISGAHMTVVPEF